MLKMKLKGPRGKSIRDKLKMFTNGKAMRAAEQAVADELLSLVDERFDSRTDPYNNPWAPRKQPTGGWPLLEKTRDMRTNFFTVVVGNEIRLENSISYAGYHQTGTNVMPARPLVPTGEMPYSWASRFDDAVSNALRRV